MHFSPVRRKILRLPTTPLPIFMHYDMLMINAFLSRETQNFASLLSLLSDMKSSPLL